MYKNLNNLCIHLLLALLIGCTQTPEYAATKVYPRKIHNGEQALIISKIEVPFEDLFKNKGAYQGFMVIVNVDQPELKYKITGNSYYNSAAMIQPGKYNIRAIGWSDGCFVYEFNQLQGYVLEVKSGECIYLGEMRIIQNQQIIEHIDISNNLDQAQKELQDTGLKNFASKLKLCILENKYNT